MASRSAPSNTCCSNPLKGFSWGYHGAGCADLARSLLIAALGPIGARCRRCKGISCPSCGHGYRTDMPVRAFMLEVVSGWPWPGPWEITRSHILAWLALHGVYGHD